MANVTYVLTEQSWSKLRSTQSKLRSRQGKRQRSPVSLRAITMRWISLVPS